MLNHDWTGNEDAGDLDMMHAAAYSECRPFTCPDCGYELGPAGDFVGADDATAGDCPGCESALDWATIDPQFTPPRPAGHRGY